MFLSNKISVTVSTQSSGVRTLKTQETNKKKKGERSASISITRYRRNRRDGGEESGGGVRLPVQGGADRRFGRRQVQPPLPIHPQRVLPRVEVHHWRRIR